MFDYLRKKTLPQQPQVEASSKPDLRMLLRAPSYRPLPFNAFDPIDALLRRELQRYLQRSATPTGEWFLDYLAERCAELEQEIADAERTIAENPPGSEFRP